MGDMRALLLATLALASLAGCAASSDHTDWTTNLRPPKPANPSAGPVKKPSGLAVVGEGDRGDCSYVHEQAILIGVQDEGPAPATLYMFDPSPSLDESVPARTEYWGELVGCPIADPSKGVWPTAVSLDGEGVAYVMWTYGVGQPGKSVSRLYRFDPTGPATCEPIGVELRGPTGKAFHGGMGFVTRERPADADWLFLAGAVEGDPVVRLSAWDPVNNISRTFDDSFPAGFMPDRVAGTEDGLLFAFDRLRYVEIDPNNGAVGPVRSMKVPGHHFPGSGFSMLRDDLWAFEGDGAIGSSTSRAFRHDRTTGVTTEEDSVPVYVAAAAPSTCAPSAAK